MNIILATIGSVLAGGAVAAVTVIGLVSAQSGTSGESPANVNQSVVDYGTAETAVASE